MTIEQSAGTMEEEERLRQRKLEEALEVQSLRRIISAYLNYPEAAEQDVKRYERSYRNLSDSHKALLPHYPLKFQNLRRCISVNSYFIYNMLQAFEPPLDISQNNDECNDAHGDQKPNGQLHPVDSYSERTRCSSPGTDAVRGENCTSKCEVPSSCSNWLNPFVEEAVPLVDVDKVRCIIRNIVRDWAEEGRNERDQCYRPILSELDSLFPDRDKKNPPTCLVPGAGLGRLALEISCLGFSCQGNEFSYYMMICSSFILNNTQVVGEWTIHPWIHSNCNSLSDKDQLRPVRIPDVHPASAGITQGFSMCGGDFVEVFSDPTQAGCWDSVVTCFFMDTAHNIIEYVEIISKILKDGGIWINLGPLLYHYADSYGQDEMSIELSLEDVKRVALHYGFEMQKESVIETTYSTNPLAMMQNRYFAAFWTMRKRSRD